MRTIKERINTTVNTLPFKKLPHQLIVEIVFNAVFRFIFFPAEIENRSNSESKNNHHRLKM